MGRYFLMGSCVVAPCIRSWYLLLERTVTWPGPTAAAAKMLLDQTLFAPAFLAVFITAASTLQGLSLKVLVSL